MIIIKNGERQIYHPQNPNLVLISPKLTLEDNAAGSLTFQIYKENLNYDTIHKLFPVVSVIRDNETIFKGRVILDRKDFYNGKHVEAEGKLAFLNDSCFEPFSFAGSPEELFRMIIDNHNAQVKDWQQFKVGNVTVVDSNDYIVRSSESMLNSWEMLKSKCFQSSLGGHIRIRYEEDGDYIDWLADYDAVSRQSIEFAKNILDISSEVDATETYTAIRPVGADVEGVKVDISSVNDGRTYLINEEKANEYGIIFAPESESTWEDVTLPENLLKKAEEKLYGSFAALKETYEIKAVDLHLTDGQIESLNICEYVPVVSKPHGINGQYLLNRADIDITSPQNTVYLLGATKRTLSDVHSSTQNVQVDIPKDISAFHNDAGYVSEEKAAELLADYSKTEDLGEIINQYMEQLPPGKDGLSAYEIACSYGYDGTEEEWLASLQGPPGKDADVSDLSGYALKKEIPTRLSQLENDCGFGPGNVDLSDYYTKAEVDAKLKELREWVDSVVSSGGGTTEPEPEEPEPELSVYNLKDSTRNSNWVTLNAIDVRFDVPEEIQDKVKKVVVNTCTLTIGINTGSYAPTIYFRIGGKNLSGGTRNSNITDISQSSGNGSSVTKTITNTEVNIDNFSSIEYFQLYKARSSGSGTTTSYSLSFDIDLYY